MSVKRWAAGLALALYLGATVADPRIEEAWELSWDETPDTQFHEVWCCINDPDQTCSADAFVLYGIAPAGDNQFRFRARGAPQQQLNCRVFGISLDGERRSTPSLVVSAQFSDGAEAAPAAGSGGTVTWWWVVAGLLVAAFAVGAYAWSRSRRRGER